MRRRHAVYCVRLAVSGWPLHLPKATAPTRRFEAKEPLLASSMHTEPWSLMTQGSRRDERTLLARGRRHVMIGVRVRPPTAGLTYAEAAARRVDGQRAIRIRGSAARATLRVQWARGVIAAR
jgi:hypothetical protein